MEKAYVCEVERGRSVIVYAASTREARKKFYRYFKRFSRRVNLFRGSLIDFMSTAVCRD